MALGSHWEFSKDKMFEKIRENLPKSEGKTLNLLDCKDDVIFFWDGQNKRLLTQTMKAYNKEVSLYQELHPTKPPLVDIQFIRVNCSLQKVALWGSKGVFVMDVPRRWGVLGGFQGGKSVILTKSSEIDTNYFILRNVEVKQVRFHPGSSQDDCLVVLTSDNVLRVYKLFSCDDDSETQLIHVWPLTPSCNSGGGAWRLKGSEMNFLTCLGDMAVDFDFGLPYIDEELEKENENLRVESVVWPAIILRGNGDVCLLKTSLFSSQKLKFEGPLPIFPSADDNYGVEACSILVLPTTPTVIVVATSSGTLYHSVLLENDNNGKEESVSTHCLYVIGSVELELGISVNDDDHSYSCPIFLHNDPVCSWKYYCTHNSGLHAVSASFVLPLMKFIEETFPKTLEQRSPLLRTEYLVCTRTSFSASAILCVLGFAVFTSLNVIFILLGDGRLITLPQKVTEILNREGDFMKEEISKEESTPIKKLLQNPFDVHVKNLLKRSTNQPLMKLDKNATFSPQELLEFTSRTTNLLKQEYFSKFQRVGDEIEQRVRTMRALLLLHINEITNLRNETISIQQTAEELAEKYEEVKDKQLILNKRIEKILCALHEVKPIESLAEKNMKNQLLGIEEKMENLQKSISQIQKQMNYQKHKKAELEQEKQKSVKLGENQIETIKTNLNKTSQDICDIVKVVNSIKNHLKIVDV